MHDWVKTLFADLDSLFAVLFGLGLKLNYRCDFSL